MLIKCWWGRDGSKLGGKMSLPRWETPRRIKPEQGTLRSQTPPCCYPGGNNSPKILPSSNSDVLEGFLQVEKLRQGMRCPQNAPNPNTPNKFTSANPHCGAGPAEFQRKRWENSFTAPKSSKPGQKGQPR